MKTFAYIILAFGIAVTSLDGQEKPLRGAIAYLSGDIVYISLGRDAGIRDSSFAYVISNLDTIGVLRVVATSSKSSACKIVRASRKLSIGDAFSATAGTQQPMAKAPLAQQAVRETVKTRTMAKLSVPSTKSKFSPFVTLQGQASLRYFAIMPALASNTITQPGVVLNLRLKFNRMPMQLTFLGNFRSTVYGSLSPFRGGGVNQSRIYRLSLDYDNGSNRISIGRIIPSPAPSSTGYVDGLLLSQRLGNFFFGGSGGFEPSYTPQTTSSDYKKFSVFVGYQPVQSGLYSASVAYGKTYFHTALDREVMSTTLTMNPRNDLYMFALSDVDLRTKVGDALVTKVKLTNLIANINYRLTNVVSVGGGVSAFRPSYPFSVIQTLADSLIDNRFQISPTANINLFFPFGVSFSSVYTPRTAENGFGKEYSQYSSLGFTNLLRRGINLRANLNLNRSAQTKSSGYGASLQRTFTNVVDINLRYQFYRYVFTTVGNTTTSQSMAIDWTTLLSRSVSLWGSVERSLVPDANATTILMQLSWNF